MSGSAHVTIVALMRSLKLVFRHFPPFYRHISTFFCGGGGGGGGGGGTLGRGIEFLLLPVCFFGRRNCSNKGYALLLLKVAKLIKLIPLGV